MVKENRGKGMRPLQVSFFAVFWSCSLMMKNILFITKMKNYNEYFSSFL